MDRLGLAAEGIESVMVEIGGGEVVVPLRREPPGAVVEALAGDVDIVAVKDAVDEARDHVAGGEFRGCAGDEVEQAKAVFLRIVDRLFAVELLKAVANQGVDVLYLAVEGEALKRANADV